MVATSSPTTYRLLTTPKDVARAASYFQTKQEPIYIDTETTGLNPRQNKLVMIQMKVANDPTLILDCRRLGRCLVDLLKPLFKTHLFVGHNAKFDYNFLGQRGLFMSKVWDTQVGEQVLWGLGLSDARIQGKGMTLAELSKRYSNVMMSKEERNWFIDLDQREDEWNAPFPEEQLVYSALDVDVLPEIYSKQVTDLHRRELFAVAELEMRTLPALAQMELAGIKIDTEGWQAFIEQKTRETLTLEDRLLGLVGPVILERQWAAYDEQKALHDTYQAEKEAAVTEWRETWESVPNGLSWGDFKREAARHWKESHPFVAKPHVVTDLVNVNSSTVMLDALNAMGIPVMSTSSILLEELRGEHEVIDALLDYRKCVKFVQSFGASLLSKVADDKRIHPNYVQLGASTGRMSCTSPNWQQVPSKGDGQHLRQLVKADAGYKLITADFSNIELRILADLSQDPTMLRLFREGKDLHAATAIMMFDLPADTPVERLKDKNHGPVPGWAYRDVAKTINFGLVYGMSATKLGRTIKVSKEAADALMQKYFTLYAGVKRWLDAIGRDGVRDCVSTTMAGRKRFYTLPPQPVPPMGNDRSVDAWEAYHTLEHEFRRQQARVERQSKNTPIQGTSADITKLALALWHEHGFDTKEARLVACVHDELVIEALADMADWMYKPYLEEVMYQAATTYLKNVHVPPTEAVISDTWEH